MCQGSSQRVKERETKRQRERSTCRHGPQTLMLLREPVSRSQSVACPSRRFQGAHRFQHPQKKKNLLNGQTLWSVLQDGWKRDQKKKRACGDTCTSRERRHPRVPLERERLQGLSVPASLGVTLEFDRSFIVWPEGPVLRPTGVFMGKWRSGCDSRHGLMVVERSRHSSTTRRQGREKGEGRRRGSEEEGRERE